MANRVMRDSTTATDIPISGTQLVAGYGNGLYTWSAADLNRFPHIPHVYIDVNVMWRIESSRCSARGRPCASRKPQSKMR